MDRWRKFFFFSFGLILLVLSYFGIIMPGIPAIPFILLSGWCFLNSSTRLYEWMLKRKIIGPVLKKFYSEDGVSKRMKWFVISQLWVSLIVAQIIFRLTLPWMIILNSLGVLGSILIYRLIKQSVNE